MTSSTEGESFLSKTTAFSTLDLHEEEDEEDPDQDDEDDDDEDENEDDEELDKSPGNGLCHSTTVIPARANYGQNAT